MGLFDVLSERMYAETSQKKMSNARIAFALLCGLAVCCSVMYITADAGDEYMHEVIKGHDAGSSVGSTDVLKAGQIYSETPDGRMRLMDYFNNVEKEISDEVANRKADIASVRAQMARDFAFNAAARAKLKRQMLHKMAVNAKKCRDDLNDAMRKKIHNLGEVVKKNDAKADKKIEHLTGVVKANAAKSAKGRREIAALEEANKNELHHSIRQAIAKGEKRAQLVEKRGAKMDKDTRWLINNKLNTEISKLRDETNASVEALALQSKAARAEMKKEMLYAIRSAADVAKKDLAIAIRDGVNKMKSFQKRAAASHASSALARKALASRIASNAKAVSRMIRDAVATDARARLALKEETAKAIKKTNTRVDAYANQMRAQAKKARGEIKALATATVAKVRAEQARAQAALKKFTSKDAARQKAALKFAATQLQIAEKESAQKFGKAYERLAANRARFDKKLGAATTGLNDALATQVATVTTEVKNVETRLVGEIAVVSGEVISNR